MSELDFTTVAAQRDPPLERIALAIAAEFRSVDSARAAEELDRLGAELARDATSVAADAFDQAELCRRTLGERHGFTGDHDRYDDPTNSMLDLVLERRRGLPILLSIVYVEAGRRAGIPLAGVGLPGHYVVGHFGVEPPLLIDAFAGGVALVADVPPALVRPWRPHETALRMLNNLVGSYSKRGDVGRAIHAAALRLALPLDDDARRALEHEHRVLAARLN